MQIVPLQPVPSQTLTITLDGQIVTLSVYTLDTPPTLVQVTDGYGHIVLNGAGLPVLALQNDTYPAVYADITLNGALIVSNKLAAVLQPLLSTSQYQGFHGELVFVDTQNPTLADATQPLYTGLGSQYQLVYLSPSDLA